LCWRTVYRSEIPHFLNPQNVVQHAEKANAQIGTFGFCRHNANAEKPKELALTHR